jgi:hypothetical protein
MSAVDPQGADGTPSPGCGMLAIGIAFVAGLAIFGSSSASAQSQNSTTNCYRVGNQVQCNTVSQGSTLSVPPPPDYSRLNAPAAQTDYGALGAALRAREQRETRRRVGRYVANGQCADARRAALESGDFDLAQQVDATCR